MPSDTEQVSPAANTDVPESSQEPVKQSVGDNPSSQPENPAGSPDVENSPPAETPDADALASRPVEQTPPPLSDELWKDLERRGYILELPAPESCNITAAPPFKELAELVVDRFPTDRTFGEARPGDVPSALVSPALAEKTLGWHEVTHFETGLGHLLEDESDVT